MTYVDNKLYVDDRLNSTMIYKEVPHKQHARTLGTRQIKYVNENEVFNVKGLNGKSFVKSKHISTNVTRIDNMVQLRPWLRNVGCHGGKTCGPDQRQGTFGHYIEQYDLVAGPLT